MPSKNVHRASAIAVLPKLSEVSVTRTRPHTYSKDSTEARDQARQTKVHNLELQLWNIETDLAQHEAQLTAPLDGLPIRDGEDASLLESIRQGKILRLRAMAAINALRVMKV